MPSGKLLEAKIDEFGPRYTLDDGKLRQVPFRGWSGSALGPTPARVGVGLRHASITSKAR
jgi:hypothetical protein